MMKLCYKSAHLCDDPAAYVVEVDVRQKSLPPKGTDVWLK
jgi:hypothetical protein